MPDFYWTHALLATIHGQLGQQGEATRAAARLLEPYPDFEERALIELRRRHFEPALLNRFVDGLRKAGLDIPERPPPAGSADRSSSPGPIRRARRLAGNVTATYCPDLQRARKKALTIDPQRTVRSDSLAVPHRCFSDQFQTSGSLPWPEA